LILTLQKIDNHQHQRITGQGHFFGIVDVVIGRPEFDGQHQRPDSVIDCNQYGNNEEEQNMSSILKTKN